MPIETDIKDRTSVSATGLAKIRHEFRVLADPVVAAHSTRFFKSGPGEYGEGDRFLGIRVPQTRRFVRPCRTLDLEQLRELLYSPWHEERLLALLSMVDRYQRGSDDSREVVFGFYLAHRAQVNNWDLVDSSAHKIVGPTLEAGDRGLLYRLAGSKSLWDRRIAVLATFHFIRQDDFSDILNLAAALLSDPEDLMHKAVGWMLREVGKRDVAVLRQFLDLHCRAMPRTMLRYAIEKLPAGQRNAYLQGEPICAAG